MQVFVIGNGVIENIIEADEGFTIPGKTLVSTDGHIASIGWSWIDGAPVPPENPTVEPLTFGERVMRKMKRLSDLRWEKEVGGMMFGSFPVKTDRETAAILTAAYVKALNNPSYVIPDWKIADGVFVTLDSPTIIMLGDAVEAHVQACFTREKVLTMEIMSAQDASELAAIDITVGWP